MLNKIINLIEKVTGHIWLKTTAYTVGKNTIVKEKTCILCGAIHSSVRLN